MTRRRAAAMAAMAAVAAAATAGAPGEARAGPAASVSGGVSVEGRGFFSIRRISPASGGMASPSLSSPNSILSGTT